MCPSDLFGNFYMEPIDRFLKEYGVRAARYVDHVYVFLDSVEAALSQAEKHTDSSVKIALDLLQDGNRHETLRAVAAIFVGRFGDYSRRVTLLAVYTISSPYMQSAIYFSSRRWPKAEKLTAKNNWGSHGELNRLLARAMSKK
jgi:hypothetical protein